MYFGMHDYLSSLDLDIILHIIDWLVLKDVISLRRTSRYFASVMSLRNIWHKQLEQEILRRDLPLVPRSPSANSDISIYTAYELEQATRASIQHEKRWQEAERVRSMHLQVNCSKIFITEFIGAPEGRYLLMYGFESGSGDVCLKVFDLKEAFTAGKCAAPIGHFKERGRILGSCTHNVSKTGDDSTSTEVTIAVAIRRLLPSTETNIYIHTFKNDESTHASPQCLRMRSILHSQSLVYVHALRGNLAIIESMQNMHSLSQPYHPFLVVDWRQSGEIVNADLSSCPVVRLSGGEEKSSIATAKFIHDWVILSLKDVILFYFLPPHLFTQLSNSTGILKPTALYEWQWSISSLVMAERKSWKLDRSEHLCVICKSTGCVKISADSEGTSANHEEAQVVCVCRYRPLSLIIRFDSRFYPWPINILHHYILDVQSCQTSSFFTLAEQIPYVLPPLLLHTVSSPIELMTLSQVALDSYGMLLWMDNESCLVPSAFLPKNLQPGFQLEAKRRLAGVRLGLAGQRESMPENLHSPETEDPEDAVPSNQRRLGFWDSQNTPQESVSARTRIYAASVSDDWWTFDFRAAAGRIAVGYSDGRLEVWDYV